MWFSCIPCSSIQLLQLGQIQVGRPEFWIQNFEIRRWRETVTVATASCVLSYENLDLHSSPGPCIVWSINSIEIFACMKRQPAFKEVQNWTRSGSPIVKILRNYGENGEICDVSRFRCQQANYVMNNNLITTCNNGMKFCILKVLQKRQFNA